MFHTHQTVADLVLEHSECAEVFQRHRIDFCCRGELSLEAAAAAAGVEVDPLRAELERAIAERRGAKPADPRTLSTPALIAYIISKHHEYLRQTLPFVRGLAAKVGRVHGGHNPRLPGLATDVETLAQTLITYLDEEEQVLFPALCARDLDQARVARSLAGMMDEHLEVGALLARIRAASEDYALPEWACSSYRTLFAELRQLESDVFTHVHLENHVLRPRYSREVEES